MSLSDEELEKMVDEVCKKLGSCSERQANIINEALRTVRDSVVQLPSFEQFENWWLCSEDRTIRGSYNWLRSQIVYSKSEAINHEPQMQRPTYEEIKEFVFTCYKGEPTMSIFWQAYVDCVDWAFTRHEARILEVKK